MISSHNAWDQMNCLMLIKCTNASGLLTSPCSFRFLLLVGNWISVSFAIFIRCFMIKFAGCSFWDYKSMEKETGEIFLAILWNRRQPLRWQAMHKNTSLDNSYQKKGKKKEGPVSMTSQLSISLKSLLHHQNLLRRISLQFFQSQISHPK